jgi:hydroxylaminobenzene mutase
MIEIARVSPDQPAQFRAAEFAFGQYNRLWRGTNLFLRGLANMTARNGSRRVLLHGLMMVLVGLTWGFVVPMTPYPRLALVAHIQLTGNGLLFIVLAMLLQTVPNRVGTKSISVMLVSVWLTWAMLLSQAANAWWGTNQMLPIAAEQAGATGALPWQELVVKLAHIAAGLGLLVAWTLLVVGFVKAPDDENPK